MIPLELIHIAGIMMFTIGLYGLFTQTKRYQADDVHRALA